MKSIYLGLISLFLSSTVVAQKNNFLVGNVIKFSRVENFRHTIIDTVVGQSRTITLDTLSKQIWIQWQINESVIPFSYEITTIKNTVNYNQTTKKNQEYLTINFKDDDGYPLMIMFAIDFKTAFLYYFWSNNEQSFKKSEKIEIKEIKNISL